MSARYSFWTLIFVVAIAGAIQGLTLPLLSVLLAKDGFSSIATGSSAAALYIGILLASPFQELILRKFGYRSTIFIGLIMVTFTILLFPLLKGFVIWIVLRLVLGIGDSMLHYGAQMWIAQSSSQEKRGQNLTIYGFSYGAGFNIGPVGIFLLPFGVWYPFLSLVVILLLAFVLLSRLKNAYPEAVQESHVQKENRYLAAIRLGWLALVPALLYGFLETTLNVSFPVYAVHANWPLKWVSLLLQVFTFGGLIVQIPMGRFSDRVGRKKVLMFDAFVGAIGFCLFPLAVHSLWLMLLLLLLIGVAVGSFYSLGLAYAADIMPASLIPAIGTIAGVNYSFGCIFAPTVNGALMQYSWPEMIFVLMGVYLLIFVVLGFFFRRNRSPVQAQDDAISC